MYVKIYQEDIDSVTSKVLTDVTAVTHKDNKITVLYSKDSIQRITKGWVETYNSNTDRLVVTFETK